MKKLWKVHPFVISILFFLGGFNSSYSQVVYIAEMPEWDENPNVEFFKNSHKKGLFITTEVPSKRALVLFSEKKDGCYYPANPDFIKQHMPKYTKIEQDKFLFTPSDRLSLKGVSLKEKILSKDLSLYNAVTIMASEVAISQIEKMIPRTFKVESETKALQMLVKKRADIAFIWSVSKESHLSKFRTVPGTTIYDFDLGLFCYDTKKNNEISELFKNWLKNKK